MSGGTALMHLRGIACGIPSLEMEFCLCIVLFLLALQPAPALPSQALGNQVCEKPAESKESLQHYEEYLET